MAATTLVGSHKTNKGDDDAADTTCTCTTSLMELTLQMALDSAPPHSAPWNKTKALLQAATAFRIVKPRQTRIFDSITDDFVRMFQGYGLKRLNDETVIDSDAYFANGQEGGGGIHSIIIVEHAFFMGRVEGDALPKPEKCSGSHCAEIPRIILQAEQAPYFQKAPLLFPLCHQKPHCVLWDFSQFNLEYYQTNLPNVSDSTMIMPLMFHDRFKWHYYSNSTLLTPLHRRSLDFSFFGAMLDRRLVFRDRMMDPNNNMSLAHRHWNFKYEKNTKEQPQIDAYKDSKICLILHSYGSDSGGEFHRWSDFKRFGCIPVVETMQEPRVVSDTLRQCAGAVFADYEDLLHALVEERERIQTTSADILAHQQQSVDAWWAQGIQWETFLERVLGPRHGA